jgi:hypothetical protein
VTHPELTSVPPMTPSLPRRANGQLDGHDIVRVEPRLDGRGEPSTTCEKLLLDDGRELLGCLRCGFVAETIASMGSHNRSHAPRYNNGQAPAPVPTPPPARDIADIAADITANRVRFTALLAEMDAACRALRGRD